MVTERSKSTKAHIGADVCDGQTHYHCAAEALEFDGRARMRSRWIAALPLALILLVSCTTEDSEETTAPASVTEITATLSTSMGVIVIALHADQAPDTVTNFTRYAKEGSYDGTIFHRVIPEFMIQGGGFDEGMGKRPTHKAVKNESDNGLSNTRGTIAMARTQDPHSATSQFFINLIDNNFLDYGAQGANRWGYAVFGTVISGKEVVDHIQNVETTRAGQYSDVPKTPITINSVRVEPAKE